MDALNMVVQVPAWAYDFCFYYLAAAAVAVVYSLYSIAQLWMLPAFVQKIVPVGSLTIAFLVSGTVMALIVMMQFWVCRSALSPSAAKEHFAVMCKKTEDCLAVAGTQHCDKSLCTCGARGLCAGCTMDNNMEPSMLDQYDEPYAAFKDTTYAVGHDGHYPS